MRPFSSTAIALVCLGLLPGCTVILDFSDPVGTGIDGAVDSTDAGVDAPVGNDMCGDGVVQAPETCDDMNQADLDGCSADCNVEAGYACSEEPSTCATVAICPAQSIVSSGPLLDSCLSYLAAGYRASGIYRIDPDGAAPQLAFDAICDMTTAGGGWTIVVNNVADAVEPEGCLPRLATVDAFACGMASCSQDYNVPVYGMPFNELAWVAHDGNLVLGSHRLFSWATPRTLGNIANWTLNAEQFDAPIAGLEAEALIECQRAAVPIGLRRVANANVQTASGGFAITDVVTVFDQDTNPLTPGNMSFTDVASAGLDDFQDGSGCGDAWAPIASRGAATLIMLR